MTLEELYKKDINRTVNPAVSVEDKNDNTITTEIDEYVFTNTIIKGLYELLCTIRNTKKMQDGREVKVFNHVGVWIDGYYGSGKSHYLKYFNYCTDSQYSERAMNRLIEAVSAIDPMNAAAEGLPSVSDLQDMARWFKNLNRKVIMVNLLTHRDDNDKEKNNSFLKIFWNKLNAERGYSPYSFVIAQHLEKPLDKVGVLAEWQQIMKENGIDPSTSYGAVALEGEIDFAIEEARKLAPSLSYDVIRARIINNNDVISNDTFAQEVCEYLDSDKMQGDKKDRRIFFLADEVSLFVNGNGDLLGQLQEMVTQLSSVCDNRVWVLCTAQQNLETLITDCKIDKATENYGKIMGRFEVRQSLESTNAKFITQQRILDKKDEAVPALNALYDANHLAIEAQYNLPTGFKSYTDQENFVQYYPVVPFQMDLILKVFSAFQSRGFVMREVEGNERSIIRVTHATAMETREEKVGKFLTFDQFYNTMFRNSMQDRGNKAIENALTIAKEYTQNPAFAERVVNVLFMICNLLTEDQQRYPATLNNITILLIDDVTVNKGVLQQQVKDVIDFLQDKHILRSEKNDANMEVYKFYTDAEREVARDIEMAQLDQTDMPRYIKNLYLDAKAIGKMPQKVTYKDRAFQFYYVFMKDAELYTSSNSDMKVDFCLESNYDDLATHVMMTHVTANQQTFFLAPAYMQNRNLQKQFKWFCQIQKVVEAGCNDAEKQRVIDNFKARALESYRTEILPAFMDLFNTCETASGTDVLRPADLGGTTGATRLSKAMELHHANYYRQASLVDSSTMPKNQTELKARILSAIDPNEYGPLNPMSPAETEMTTIISRKLMSREPTLSELVKDFGNAPYGWAEVRTLYIINELVRRQAFDYQVSNSIASARQVANCIDSNQMAYVSLKAAQLISQQMINDFSTAWHNIFNEPMSTSTSNGNTLAETCREKLESWIESYNNYALDAGNYPFAQTIMNAAKQMGEWKKERDPQKFMQGIIGQKDAGKRLMDSANAAINFVQKQLANYQKVLTFLSNNKDNFDCLAPDMQALATELKAIETDPLPVMQSYGQKMVKLEAAIKAERNNIKAQIKAAYEAARLRLEGICQSNGVPVSFLDDINSHIQTVCTSSESLAVLSAKIITKQYEDQWAHMIVQEHNRLVAQQTPTPPVPGPATDPGTPIPSQPTPQVKTIIHQLQVQPKTLHNEQEVDAYVAAIKAELMKHIIEGQQSVQVM